MEKFKAITLDGYPAGRIKDLFFDDESWKIKYFVLSIEPFRHGWKHVLVDPGSVTGFWEEGVVCLGQTMKEIDAAPLASSVLPVCKQYGALAFGSPGGGMAGQGMLRSDPHLRSAKAVMNYAINVAGEYIGSVADLIFDDRASEIRYLAIEQSIERKRLRFHVLPQSVERITWATQRVILRELQPVSLGASTAIPWEVQAA